MALLPEQSLSPAGDGRRTRDQMISDKEKDQNPIQCNGTAKWHDFEGLHDLGL